MKIKCASGDGSLLKIGNSVTTNVVVELSNHIDGECILVHVSRVDAIKMRDAINQYINNQPIEESE